MSIILASLIAPFFLEVTPEIRSTYLSLGKIAEDRPMQVTSVRAGWDTGILGRIGFRNWDVSSLSDRRSDAHRHALYLTEFGPIWQHDLKFNDDWCCRSDLTRSWSIYDGSHVPKGNATYHWWEFGQSLDNPYLTPMYRIRRGIRNSDYFYFRIGLNKHLPLLGSWYLKPGVYADGGNGGNQRRMFGKRPNGRGWYDGFACAAVRLETGWRFNDEFTLFAFVEQYEIVGGEARDVNGASSYTCAHNDWTHGGVGLRMRF